jgi:hypothetical protein
MLLLLTTSTMIGMRSCCQSGYGMIEASPKHEQQRRRTRPDDRGLTQHKEGAHHGIGRAPGTVSVGLGAGQYDDDPAECVPNWSWQLACAQVEVMSLEVCKTAHPVDGQILPSETPQT